VHYSFEDSWKVSPKFWGFQNSGIGNGDGKKDFKNRKSIYYTLIYILKIKILKHRTIIKLNTSSNSYIIGSIDLV
jgi:hypothetical protein